MIFYILYALAVIAVIMLSYFLIRWKQFPSLVIGLLPAIFSFYLMWSFIKVNLNSNIPCGIDDGCMNETGLLIVLALFFIAVSCLVLLLAVLAKRISRIERGEI